MPAQTNNNPAQSLNNIIENIHKTLGFPTGILAELQNDQNNPLNLTIYIFIYNKNATPQKIIKKIINQINNFIYKKLNLNPAITINYVKLYSENGDFY